MQTFLLVITSKGYSAQRTSCVYTLFFELFVKGPYGYVYLVVADVLVIRWNVHNEKLGAVRTDLRIALPIAFLTLRFVMFHSFLRTSSNSGITSTQMTGLRFNHTASFRLSRRL